MKKPSLNQSVMTSKFFPSTYCLLQSTNTVDSTTPLYTGPSQKPQKDYAAALGTLQSRYGVGGNVPSPKNTPSMKLVDNITSISLSSASFRTEAASPSIDSKVSGSPARAEDQIKRKKVTGVKGRSSFLGLLFGGLFVH